MSNNPYAFILISAVIFGVLLGSWHLWQWYNKNRMPPKFTPIIFHGGCHGCTMQEVYGIHICPNCKYYDYGRTSRLPSLNNQPPSEADVARATLKKRGAEIEEARRKFEEDYETRRRST